MTDDINDAETEPAAPAEMELGTVQGGSDIAVALDAARPNQSLVIVHENQAAYMVRRHDTVVDVIDLEQYHDRPARVKDRWISVSTARGFSEAVKDRQGAEEANHVVLYADESERSLVAVLNDDGPAGPGWRDHRVVLNSLLTTEWKHWVGNQGLGEQDRFARTIQIGEKEIVKPSAAVMLDLAQSFHASSTANIKQAKRLRDGRTQAVWEEEQTASAGESGTLEIPETFTLAMRPFYGSEVAEVTARISWRLQSQKLSIGYELVRPEDVLREAFSRFVDTVRSELPEVPFIYGTA